MESQALFKVFLLLITTKCSFRIWFVNSKHNSQINKFFYNRLVVITARVAGQVAFPPLCLIVIRYALFIIIWAKGALIYHNLFLGNSRSIVYFYLSSIKLAVLAALPYWSSCNATIMIRDIQKAVLEGNHFKESITHWRTSPKGVRLSRRNAQSKPRLRIVPDFSTNFRWIVKKLKN